jgi:hypothetical protein
LNDANLKMSSSNANGNVLSTSNGAGSIKKKRGEPTSNTSDTVTNTVNPSTKHVDTIIGNSSNVTAGSNSASPDTTTGVTAPQTLSVSSDSQKPSKSKS